MTSALIRVVLATWERNRGNSSANRAIAILIFGIKNPRNSARRKSPTRNREKRPSRYFAFDVGNGSSLSLERNGKEVRKRQWSEELRQKPGSRPGKEPEEKEFNSERTGRNDRGEKKGGGNFEWRKRKLVREIAKITRRNSSFFHFYLIVAIYVGCFMQWGAYLK